MDPSPKTPSFQALRLTRPLVVKISSAKDVVSASWKEGLRVESHLYRSKLPLLKCSTKEMPVVFVAL